VFPPSPGPGSERALHFRYSRTLPCRRRFGADCGRPLFVGAKGAEQLGRAHEDGDTGNGGSAGEFAVGVVGFVALVDPHPDRPVQCAHLSDAGEAGSQGDRLQSLRMAVPWTSAGATLTAEGPTPARMDRDPAAPSGRASWR